MEPSLIPGTVLNINGKIDMSRPMTSIYIHQQEYYIAYYYIQVLGLLFNSKQSEAPCVSQCRAELEIIGPPGP